MNNRAYEIDHDHDPWIHAHTHTLNTIREKFLITKKSKKINHINQTCVCVCVSVGVGVGVWWKYKKKWKKDWKIFHWYDDDDDDRKFILDEWMKWNEMDAFFFCCPVFFHYVERR